VRVGNLLFVAGQLGTDSARAGIAGETTSAMLKISDLLKRSGSSLERVAKCTIMLADMKEWSVMNEAYIKFFSGAPPGAQLVWSDGTREQWTRRDRMHRDGRLTQRIALMRRWTRIAAAASLLVIARTAIAQRTDPRVGLRAGWLDAAEAISNLALVSHTDRAPGFFDPANPGLFKLINTDLAFRGDLVFQGSYHGFNIWDISDPQRPKLRTSFPCPGGQADPTVYGNLLFLSVEERSARVDCGSQGVRDAVSAERFQGVRVFDITDVDHPKQVAAVQTCRASHTNTLVVDPKDAANVYVYVSGYQPVRPADELAGCSTSADASSAMFRLEVIRVPLANPEQARIVSSPRVFDNLAAPPQHSEPDAAAGRGVAPAATDPKPTGPSQCHDITTYPALRLAAGACMGYGLCSIRATSSTRNASTPSRIPTLPYWHSATFSNDGSKVIFTDEWGGGMQPRCRATDKPEWGAGRDLRDCRRASRAQELLQAAGGSGRGRELRRP
jgi:hypothetical protein